MKTQTVFKLLITPDEKVVIHTKDYAFCQIQEIDELIKRAMKNKKEIFYYGHITPKEELRLDTAIAPKDW